MRYDEAEKVLKKVEKKFSKTKGKDHPQTLSAAASLAEVYRYTQRIDDAFKIQKRVYKARKKEYGENHGRRGKGVRH